MKFVDQFKAFALKGSVVDLAVGVVIGSAFGKVVSSLVSDIIMPPLGWLIGGVDFTSLKVTLPEVMNATNVVTINYGNFIQSIFDFLIIALAVFFAVRFMVSMHIKEEAKKADLAPTADQALLAEIRDLLKDKK